LLTLGDASTQWFLGYLYQSGRGSVVKDLALVGMVSEGRNAGIHESAGGFCRDVSERYRRAEGPRGRRTQKFDEG
jgi:hypothetical protein